MFKVVCWTNNRDMLDHDVITINIILKSLIEEKTVCKDTYTNIFRYHVTPVF